MGLLDGRVAVVTGGARGQGAAEAALFVEHGARVVIGDVLDSEGQALADELGSNAHYEHLDVSDETGWTRIVEVADDLGPLQVLVNNAAIHWLRPIEEENHDDFLRMLDVNLVGAFLGMKAVAGSMGRAGGGSIINVSSIAGLTGFALHGAYGASKWGLRGITKTGALELGDRHIRVNSVHPGAVATAMAGEISAPDRFSRVPLQRSAEPREIAELVLFLASDASAYITGTELTIDGGASAGVNAAPSTQTALPR